MARIGYWGDAEIGVFLNEEERRFLGIEHGVCLNCLPVEGGVLLKRGGTRAFAPIYDSNTEEYGEVGIFRMPIPPQNWPRFALFEPEVVERDDGLALLLPNDWWSLPWPLYRGKDVGRQATMDFLTKCVLSGEVRRPHKFVATQAINYAKKGLASEYLKRIDEFFPASDSLARG
jgi:hypothetical protein